MNHSLNLPPAKTGSTVNHYSFLFYWAGLCQEVRQQHAPPAVKPSNPTISSCHSNGRLHSQYHGYYVKADVKIPLPEEPTGVEEDLHPSNLAHFTSTDEDFQTPSLKLLSGSSLLPALPKDSTKTLEPPKQKRQESTKSKSLTETKKTSVEIVPEIVEDMVSYIIFATHFFILTLPYFAVHFPR